MTRQVVHPSKGELLYIIVGFPRKVSDEIHKFLTEEKSDELEKSTFLMLPTTPNDYKPLYSQKQIKLISQSVIQFFDKRFDSASGILSTPRRIIMLYVPSIRDGKLLNAVSFYSYGYKLEPEKSDFSHQKDWEQHQQLPLAWRHNANAARHVVFRTIHLIKNRLNSIKSHVADGGLNFLILPAKNYYYPDDNQTISSMYQEFLSGHLELSELSTIMPVIVTEDDLPAVALKRGHKMFRDCRGRYFPKDHHGRLSWPEKPSDKCSEDDRWDAYFRAMELILNQLYRFGILHGNDTLHYDVQLKKPAKLDNEEMYCAADGRVSVSGSHANTAINDKIWAPDGKITSLD